METYHTDYGWLFMSVTWLIHICNGMTYLFVQWHHSKCNTRDTTHFYAWCVSFTCNPPPWVWHDSMALLVVILHECDMTPPPWAWHDSMAYSYTHGVLIVCLASRWRIHMYMHWQCIFHEGATTHFYAWCVSFICNPRWVWHVMSVTWLNGVLCVIRKRLWGGFG